jgi:hypothetical protein
MPDELREDPGLRELPQLPPLPVPVSFVLGHPERWPELFEDPEQAPESLDQQPDRVLTHEDMAIVQTYVNLRRSGLDVRITDRFVAGELCVASGVDVSIRSKPFQSFVVGYRGDWHRPGLCRMIINFNQTLNRPGDHFIPHWIQTGLIPRDPARGEKIEALVYKGETINFDPRFCSNEFRGSLRELGVELVIETWDKKRLTSRWHDYTGVDVIIAVRNLTLRDVEAKPASKLVNAWAAGVPAILSPEPAYRELRRGPLDYFEVARPEEALAAVELLQTNGPLYAAMIANGRRRAEDFSARRIAGMWRDFLSGPATREFLAWKRSSSLRRSLSIPAGVARQRWEQLRFARAQSRGPRNLGV